MQKKPSTLAQSLASAAGKVSAVEKLPTGRVKQASGGDTVLVAAHYSREVRRTLKIIEAETDKTLRQLLGEAINDLCEKYGKPRPFSDDL